MQMKNLVEEYIIKHYGFKVYLDKALKKVKADKLSRSDRDVMYENSGINRVSREDLAVAFCTFYCASCEFEDLCELNTIHRNHKTCAAMQRIIKERMDDDDYDDW